LITCCQAARSTMFGSDILTNGIFFSYFIHYTTGHY